MQTIMDEIKRLIGDNEVLKTVVTGAGLLALLSLVILNIPLFLIFLFIAITLFLQLQKRQ